MSHPDFLSIRAWEGSKQAGFEQLCCQLFEQEPVPAGSRFIRNGKPDGGVECYWKLPDGSVLALQAKYHPDGMNAGRWAELDSSFRTAIGAHRTLSRYVVAVPYDLPDARIGGKTSARTTWEARTQKWSALAAASGRTVEFEWWGAGELTRRLDDDRNAGRWRFWFGGVRFGAAWFQEKWTRSELRVGERYQPPLDVDVPVSFHLEGLCRTEVFGDRFTDLAIEARRALKARLRTSAELLPDATRQLLEQAQQLTAELADLSVTGLAPVVIDPMLTRVMELQRASRELYQQVYRLGRENDTSSVPEKPRDVSYDLYQLDELGGALHRLSTFLSSAPFQAAVAGRLLLTGEAGSGKTHLLADFVHARILAGGAAVLLLGDDAPSEGNVATQLLRALDLQDLTLSEVLGALQAAAQARGERALLALDGVNEGHRAAWRRDLPELVAAVSRYPEIALAVSVRTTVQPYYVSEHVAAKLVRVAHPGFEGVEDQALTKFFGHFKIREPGAPLLEPEFSNPLFLFLLCRSMQSHRLDRIPEGVTGFRRLLTFFLRGVESRLSIQLGYDAGARPAVLALQEIARRMVARGEPTLPETDAEAICRFHIATTGYQGLLSSLIAEGILGRLDNPDDDMAAVTRVRFVFERIGDHLRAQELASSIRDEAGWSAAVRPGGCLAHAFVSAWAAYEHGGLIEALTLIAADQGIELVRMVDDEEARGVLAESFLHGLVWRPAATCTDDTTSIFVDCLNGEGTEHMALAVLFMIASRPSHPLNALWWHTCLSRLPMADRDAWWSTTLFISWEDQDHVGRLIQRSLKWALSTGRTTAVADEVVRPLATMLAWVLTTSHRPLRDRATKALVALLSDRLEVLTPLLADFASVNDPYVAERVCAVAYGCAMRTNQVRLLGPLAEQVYANVFSSGSPHPHLLLRDYARGVIERASVLGVLPDTVDLQLVRPPHTSSWRSDLPPLKALSARFRDTPAYSGSKAIFHSVAGGGDFDRYVIGTNGGSFPWTHLALGARPATSRQTLDQFDAHLDDAQRPQFLRWIVLSLEVPLRDVLEADLCDDIELVRAHPLAWTFDDGPVTAAARRVHEARESAERALKEGFTDEQLEQFIERVAEAVDTRRTRPLGYRFPPSRIYRWVLSRILELGWSEEVLGRFDRYHGRDSGRSAHKPERLGKKYQWIAWHEFLAHVADHFQFGRDPARRSPRYDGPWQIRVRDVDPSCLLTRTHEDDEREAWWSPVTCDFARGVVNDGGWLVGRPGLRSMQDLISVRDPNGQSWFVLDVHREWKEAVPRGEERAGLPQREMIVSLRAYIVRARDSARLWGWASKKTAEAGQAFPDATTRGANLFLRERPWSAAWRDSTAREPDSWTRGDGASTRAPAAFRATTETYESSASGLDCSVEEHFTLRLPTDWLADLLALRHGSEDGEWLDDTGAVGAFDPTVSNPGPGSLLLRADLLEAIQSQGFDLVWIASGERRVGAWVGDGDYDHGGYADLTAAWRLGPDGWEGWIELQPGLGDVHRYTWSPGHTQPRRTTRSAPPRE